jgi:mannose-6-phosphate isomerase-like protein (cupin superfamily)
MFRMDERMVGESVRAIGMGSKPAQSFLRTISPGDKKGNFKHGGHEFIDMLSGDIAFTIGEEKLGLHAGYSLYFDLTHTHTLKLLHKKPARFPCLFIEAP